MMIVLPIALAACLDSQPAAAINQASLAVDLGASGPVNPRGGEGHAGAAEPNRPVQVAHDGHNDVHASGTVNKIDPASHKVNLTHQPIPKIGWPTMTMDFDVAPAVNLGAIKPGVQVDFSMEQGKDGMYVIQSIAPRGAK
jgi:Cu/Ag efflux protein CusF